MPDQHDPVNERGQNQRHISALRDLREVGCEERRIDKHKDAGDRARRNGAPPPDLARIAMNSSAEVISMVAETECIKPIRICDILQGKNGPGHFLYPKTLSRKM
jgi:hypothetical protein